MQDATILQYDKKVFFKETSIVFCEKLRNGVLGLSNASTGKPQKFKKHSVLAEKQRFLSNHTECSTHHNGGQP